MMQTHLSEFAHNFSAAFISSWFSLQFYRFDKITSDSHFGSEQQQKKEEIKQFIMTTVIVVTQQQQHHQQQ